MKNLRKLLYCFIIIFIAFGATNNARAQRNIPEKFTFSQRAVILPGQSQANIEFNLPAGPRGEEWLVVHAHAAPEVMIGNTMNDIVNLGKWAVNIPVVQRYTAAGITVPFVLLSEGPRHVAAFLPAGQPPVQPFIVTVKLLPGVPASHRFEFNVHVTFARAKPFIP